MKSTRTLTVIAMSLCAAMMMATPAFAIGKPYKSYGTLTANPGEEEPAKKTKADRAKDRAFSSWNNSSVKIYPDALKRMMHVTAKQNDGKQVEFFVFDLEGTLVQNYKLKSRDHVRIQGLAKGSYVYRVFSGDEETAAGKFEIR
jgi:hypothetical protein